MKNNTSFLRNVISIFLASSGDLVPEREEVKKVVERINKGIGKKVGWVIDLLGWEDTRPGFSRPQELINKDVEKCDLFLGILWKRWGQPTGKYDSGFHEEYCLSRELNLISRKPEIWLYFKSIDQEALKDPGDQLKKVIKFKSDQIDKKELCFKEFKDIDEWKELIFDNLQNYLFELSEENRKIEVESVNRSNIQAEKSKPISSVKQASFEKVPSELLFLFDKLKLNYDKNDLTKIDIWDRVRLYLNATTLISEKISSELIGIHEINILFRQRIKWNFTKEESWFLFKSIVCDKYMVRPGWFWFKDWDEKRIDDALCFLAESDTNLVTKQMSLYLLAESKYIANNEMINKFFSNENEEIIINTIKLIKNLNRIEFVKDLEDKIKTTKNSKIKNYAIEALFEIQFNIDPNEAISNLIKYGTEIPLKIKEDSSLLDKIDNEILYKLILEGSSNIKKFIANYLIHTNKLSEEISKTLKDDIDLDIRKELLISEIEKKQIADISFIDKWISEQNSKFKTLSTESNIDKNELLKIVISNKEKEELIELLESNSLHSFIYYQVLAENYFDFFEDRIKTDLEDDFNKTVTKYMRDLTGNEPKSMTYQELTEFVKSKFIAAAFKGLSKNGNQSYLKIARKYLGKTLYYLADNDVIKIISKFGDKSDIQKLMHISSKLPQKSKDYAIETSIKLSDNKNYFIKKLLRNKDSEIVTIAAQHIKDLPVKYQIHLSKRLLLNKNDNLRSISLSILISKCHRNELEKTLDKYILNESYYYNVVTWIDRCLYAKGRYGKYFKNEIMSLK